MKLQDMQFQIIKYPSGFNISYNILRMGESPGEYIMFLSSLDLLSKIFLGLKVI